MSGWNLPWGGSGCRCGQVRLRINAPPLVRIEAVTPITASHGRALSVQLRRGQYRHAKLSGALSQAQNRLVPGDQPARLRVIRQCEKVLIVSVPATRKAGGQQQFIQAEVIRQRGIGSLRLIARQYLLPLEKFQLALRISQYAL